MTGQESVFPIDLESLANDILKYSQDLTCVDKYTIKDNRIGATVQRSPDMLEKESTYTITFKNCTITMNPYRKLRRAFTCAMLQAKAFDRLKAAAK